jgi:hypothetical protein
MKYALQIGLVFAITWFPLKFTYAQELCSGKAITGRWDAYAFIQGQIEGTYLTCDLEISAGGNLQGSTCRLKGDGGFVYPKPFQVSGKVAITDTSKCRFSGSFKLAGVPQQSKTASYSIPQMSLNHVAGVATGIIVYEDPSSGYSEDGTINMTQTP